MKNSLLILLLVSMITFSCRQTGSVNTQLFNTQKLPSELFTIYVNRDTVINTSEGALIQILKGTITTANADDSVTIEIKEAYNIKQMILAGLTTQSNGRPLSSGGMIYINALGGNSVKISKPIAISIPTPFVNDKMKLFKGDTSVTGTINWVEPVSLPLDTSTKRLINGNQLFATHCATCHTIGKPLTGPDLAYIQSRTEDKNLLYAFTRNPVLVTANDSYYRCLQRQYNGVLMTGFPDLSDSLLDNLYSYIENESRVQNLPMPEADIRGCLDSCETYIRLKDKLTSEKNNLSSENIDMIVREIITEEQTFATQTIPAAASSSGSRILPSSDKVTSVTHQSLYYQFTIQTFGWFNIDILLDDINTEKSSLIVRISGEYRKNISIWLVIPDLKVLLPAGLLANKAEEYGFDNSDGTIPLPQHSEAYVLAFGEVDDRMVFAKRDFVIKSEQQFDLTPTLIALEDFNSAMRNLPGSEGMQIAVKSPKNSDTLRAIIKELNDVEKIKPKLCDCDCLLWNTPPIEASDTTKVLP